MAISQRLGTLRKMKANIKWADPRLSIDRIVKRIPLDGLPVYDNITGPPEPTDRDLKILELEILEEFWLGGFGNAVGFRCKAKK